MYQKNLWQDHVVEYPNRFKETSLGNGLVEEVPAPGEIINQGTPQSARNFNNMEDGIFNANEMADFLVLQILKNQRGLEATNEMADSLASQIIQTQQGKGIFEANEIVDFLTVQLMQNKRKLEIIKGESGTVKMINSQTYPFNSSGSTLALATPRDTTDYFVMIEVLDEVGGSAGNVTVYNKLANGFKIKFDGSAKEVTVRYNVTGGGI